MCTGLQEKWRAKIDKTFALRFEKDKEWRVKLEWQISITSYDDSIPDQNERRKGHFSEIFDQDIYMIGFEIQV